MTKETDYLIIGAGAMGIAFADEIFTRKPKLRLTLVDRRPQAGGHWNDAYPYVKLHQPAAFYGVNSMELGTGSGDLSSKSEILAYYNKVMDKFAASGRVEFLSEHDYLGNGQVINLHQPGEVIKYKINKRLVDATYMKVEVPATSQPKYEVHEGVSLLPLNDLVKEYDQWEKFYVIGNGKTGMDAILFLLEKGVKPESIHWICPNQAWLFNRDFVRVGDVGKEILKHVVLLSKASKVDDIFLPLEKEGGITRINPSSLPSKWRCATVNPHEIEQLRRIKQVIQKGRINQISPNTIHLQEGTVTFSGRALFVDCSANGLSKREKTPIFTKDTITLQSILFCQQVFSAATIARLALSNLSDKTRNKLTAVPHPEWKEDWPSAVSVSIENLLLLHRFFPMWMFRSRLNFMSHEPMMNYFASSVKAMLYVSSVRKAVERLKHKT